MHYSLTRATAWNLAGYLYLLVASLISTPVLIHSLGLAQFGQYSLIIAAIIFVSSINLGLPQAVVRALARDHEFSPRRQTIWTTSSLLFILTGLVAGGVASMLVSWIHVAPAVIAIVFATGLTNNLVSHYLTLPQAEGHFGYFNCKTFIIGTGNTLLAAFLAWRGQGIVTILSFQLFCYLITLLPLAYFSLKFFPRPRDGQAKLPVARSLTFFGLKNWGSKLVGQVEVQYAKYLLAALSPLTLSAYVIAQGLVMTAAGGIGQLATAIYPAASRGGRSLTSLYHSLQLGLVFLGLLGIGIYHLIAYPFLTWWLHSPDLVALVISVLNIFIWYLSLLILCPLASAMLEGHGHPGLNSLFATATTILEITFALILLPRFGLFAPVYAALAAAILTTPLLLFATERVLRTTRV